MSVVHDAPRAAAARAVAPFAAGSGASSSASSRDARHLALLEHAVTVCLSPLDYPDGLAWGEALGDALAALAGAIGGAIMLPTGVPKWTDFGAPLGSSSTGSMSASHDEATERLGIGDGDPLGAAICWARDVLDPTESLQTGSASEQPCGAVGIRVRAANGAVAAVYVRRDVASGPIAECAIPAFRAIAPAFQAGVNAWLNATTSRSTVERMIDSLNEAALLFDVEGNVMHTNSAMDRLTSQVAARLRDEAQRVAWSLAALVRRRPTPVSSGGPSANTSDGRSTRTVHVGALVYRLRGSVVGEHLVGSRPAVLVTITATAAEPLSDDVLHAEYGLTPREVQVARLIARGLSNIEIAEQLGVRFFTARNHVERTLAKLGLASRHRVGPLLRNELGDADMEGRATAA